MTVRNRRSLTIATVNAVLGEGQPGRVSVSAVVVDDGSTDGTRAALAGYAGRVEVVEGSGDLYWAAGMACAERAALRARHDRTQSSYLLWINDDVVLNPGFLHLMLDASRAHGDAVVAGATRDPDSGATTYSGLIRSGRHPLNFTMVEPALDATRSIDTFNGNLVLVPSRIAEQLGGIDGEFAHAYADLDYGLRLRQAGWQVILAPGHLGECRRNPAAGTWTDPSLSAIQRIRLLHDRKGAPPRSSARFLRRHGGPGWLAFVATPYLRVAAESLVRSVVDMRQIRSVVDRDGRRSEGMRRQ